MCLYTKSSPECLDDEPQSTFYDGSVIDYKWRGEVPLSVYGCVSVTWRKSRLFSVVQNTTITATPSLLYQVVLAPAITHLLPNPHVTHAFIDWPKMPSPNKNCRWFYILKDWSLQKYPSGFPPH